MRLLNIKFDKCGEILSQLDLMNAKTCHEWVETIIDEDDLCVIMRDKRGNYRHARFYDNCPNLELEAKEHALNHAKSKKCNFDALNLAKFVDKRFRETYADILNQDELKNDKFIRSVESCRSDLLRWGAKYDKNTKRPYFEGHERPDVVLKRKELVSKLMRDKDLYIAPDFDQNLRLLNWVRPIRKVKILISHDESTYRSGEISLKRWMWDDIVAFFNKGRGRSIMISAFLVGGTDGMFILSEDEWKTCIKDHPELAENDEFLNYYPRSATAWIEPKKDNYFNNQQILKQFERLFVMLKYKKSFQNCEIEVIVDNARTHTAKKYDPNHFNKKPGTNCIYDKIEWIEDSETKM